MALAKVVVTQKICDHNNNHKLYKAIRNVKIPRAFNHIHVVHKIKT